METLPTWANYLLIIGLPIASFVVSVLVGRNKMNADKRAEDKRIRNAMFKLEVEEIMEPKIKTQSDNLSTVHSEIKNMQYATDTINKEIDKIERRLDKTMDTLHCIDTRVTKVESKTGHYISNNGLEG